MGSELLTADAVVGTVRASCDRAGCMAVSICPFTHIQNRCANVSHTLGPPKSPYTTFRMHLLVFRIQSRIHRRPSVFGTWLLSGHRSLTFRASGPGWLLGCHSHEPLPTARHRPLSFSSPFYSFLQGLIALPNWKLPLWKSSHEGQDA